MWGSISLSQGRLDGMNVPYIRTRTTQPGLSIVPISQVLSDDLNKNFEFDRTDPKTYKEYVDATVKYMEQYGENVGLLTRENIEKDYSQGILTLLVKLNRVSGWVPKGFQSPQGIMDRGFFNVGEDGSKNAVMEFDDDSFENNGVYFYCNQTNPDDNTNQYGIDEKNKMELSFSNGHGQDPFPSTNYGWIPDKEYVALNAAFAKGDGKKKKLKAPYVILKAKATNNKLQTSTCWSVTQNTQVQRNIDVGMFSFGFTDKGFPSKSDESE